MTGEVKITFLGFNRLMNSLRSIAASNPEIGDEPVRQFSQEMRLTLKKTKYPAKLPDQKYVRTGRLANSWKVQGQGPPARYEVINTARNPKSGRLYAGWVVGVNQAPIHKGRWWIAVEVVKEHSPKLVKMLNDIYSKLWGK